MTFPRRPLLLLAVIVLGACSPVFKPSPSPYAPSIAPTAGSATAGPTAAQTPSATADQSASALGGEWFCYSYQAGVGTDAVNVSGIVGGNSLLGSFHIEDASTYASFYGADHGTYGIDPATSGISFESGGMLGLAGTYGAGPNSDLIDLHGIGNGWDLPYVVSLICQHA
ncbi:MAG: hypothetical protein ABI573_03565 [Chloroflexota bacterium]